MNEAVRKTPTMRCPICQTATDVAFKPFCSKRCSDIDLNRWLTGVYAVPVREEEDEDGTRPADGVEEQKE